MVTLTILFTGKVTTPILQVEELRLKEVMRLVEAHTAAQGGVGTQTQQDSRVSWWGGHCITARS